MTGSKNILSSDVEIRGNLRFSYDLIIDGRIEGEMNSLLEKTPGSLAISKLALLSFSVK
jgi:cytoskeletal protein CcmA (bactofilin family)